MNLKEILIKNFVNKDETDNLFNLIRLNKLIDNNNIIEKYVLTNIDLIINIVDKNSDLLEKFKYKNEILAIYDLYKFISCDIVYNNPSNNNSSNNRKLLDNYINIMLKYNFNENDRAFILYLLYFIINNKYFKYFIEFKFLLTKTIQQIIGVIRIIEFNLDIYNYVEFLDKHNIKKSKLHFFNRDKYILEYIPCVDDDNYIKFKLDRNYNFEIYKNIFYDDYRLEKNILGNIFNYNGKYYIGEYNESIRVSECLYLEINEFNINNNILIESLSINLSDILKLLNGDIEIKTTYNGLIVNDKYVKNNVYTHNFLKYGLRKIIYELNNL